MYIKIQKQPTQTVISIFLNETPVFSGLQKLLMYKINYVLLSV